MPTAAMIQAAKALRKQVNQLDFTPPVTHIYNPLNYAWAAHEQYLHRYAKASCRVLFLGMNPGPWGMAQTGIPFGEIEHVRDWMQIDAAIGKPEQEHPKRPVEGLACTRSEVSGRRLWGLFKERYLSADAFFNEHFVANYCPLVFMEASSRNRTPDKLPAEERTVLEQACDTHLKAVLDTLHPAWAIGVGAFAEKCLKRVLKGNQAIQIGKILHPSPASPAANRDWAGTACRQLIEQKIWSE